MPLRREAEWPDLRHAASATSPTSPVNCSRPRPAAAIWHSLSWHGRRFDRSDRRAGRSVFCRHFRCARLHRWWTIKVLPRPARNVRLFSRGCRRCRVGYPDSWCSAISAWAPRDTPKEVVARLYDSVKEGADASKHAGIVRNARSATDLRRRTSLRASWNAISPPSSVGRANSAPSQNKRRPFSSRIQPSPELERYSKRFRCVVRR
jgi:hypothetical protein